MSNFQRHQYPTTSTSAQQGAVLIVVLLFLVLIILAGVIAVRQSTTDLRLATSDQIDTLLLQSADNANQNIEQSINGGSNSAAYTDMVSLSGPFGHFILNANNSGNEYVFCFRPRDRLFNINKTSIKTPTGGTQTSTGYCQPSVADDYISNRNSSMTQLSVALTPPSADNEAFGSYTIGQGTSSISSKAFMFDINSTAVLPSYGDTEADGKDCFKQTSMLHTVTDDVDSIGGCMAKAGVPSKIIYEMAEVENQSLRTKCVEFGTGSGLLCTLPTS